MWIPVRRSVVEFRAERGTLDSCRGRGLPGQATVSVPCKMFQAPSDLISTLWKLKKKYVHQLWRRTGVATRGIKPSEIVAREHCQLHVSQTGGAEVVNGPTR